jgi:thiol-disulfide isomerase/thioredoxin
MRTILITICFSVTSAFSYGQKKEINFQSGTFSDLKAKAKKENKLIFVDAYTTWCGPCKWMDKNIYTNDTVADYFNSTFVNAKLDMEKGEGIEFAKQYKVGCYPNLLFIDGDGKVVHRAAGSMPAKEFISLAKESQDPQKNFSHFSDGYETHKNDPRFLQDYLKAISVRCLEANDIVNQYFSTQKDDELSQRTNWEIISTYTQDYNSREFQYLIKNIDLYYKKYTRDSVDENVKNILKGQGFDILFDKKSSEEQFANYQEGVKKLDYSGTGEVLFDLDMAYFERKENWKAYVRTAIEKGDLYLKTANQKNNIAWAIYSHSYDPAALNKAESWMQKVVEDPKEGQQWYLYDTYAALLFKLNKVKESKAAATKAVELAKAEGVSADQYKPTTDLLDKIEALNKGKK